MERVVLGCNDSGLQHFLQGTQQMLQSSKMKGTSSWISKPMPQTFATSENTGAPTHPGTS